MDSPCPFCANIKAKETHSLVLIPECVSDQALTLNYLDALIEQPKGGGYRTQYRHYLDRVSEAFGKQAPGSSYRVLMTRDVLEGKA